MAPLLEIRGDGKRWNLKANARHNDSLDHMALCYQFRSGDYVTAKLLRLVLG